jgi:hypothetical protein
MNLFALQFLINNIHNVRSLEKTCQPKSSVPPKAKQGSKVAITLEAALTQKDNKRYS